MWTVVESDTTYCAFHSLFSVKCNINTNNVTYYRLAVAQCQWDMATRHLILYPDLQFWYTLYIVSKFVCTLTTMIVSRGYYPVWKTVASNTEKLCHKMYLKKLK